MYKYFLSKTHFKQLNSIFLILIYYLRQLIILQSNLILKIDAKNCKNGSIKTFFRALHLCFQIIFKYCCALHRYNTQKFFLNVKVSKNTSNKSCQMSNICCISALILTNLLKSYFKLCGFIISRNFLNRLLVVFEE